MRMKLFIEHEHFMKIVNNSRKGEQFLKHKYFYKIMNLLNKNIFLNLSIVFRNTDNFEKSCSLFSIVGGTFFLIRYFCEKKFVKPINMGSSFENLDARKPTMKRFEILTHGLGGKTF